MDVQARHQSSLPAHIAGSNGPTESGLYFARACQIRPTAVKTQTRNIQELPANRLLVKTTSQKILTLTTQTQQSIRTWTGANSGIAAPGCCTYVRLLRILYSPMLAS